MSTYDKAVLLNTAAGASANGVNLSNAKLSSDPFYRSDKPGNLPYGIVVTGASGMLNGRKGDVGAVEINTRNGISEIDIDLFNPLSGAKNFFKHQGEVKFNNKNNRPTHPGDVIKQFEKSKVKSGVSCS